MDDLATGDKDKKSCVRLKEDIARILGECGFKMKGFVISGDSSSECLSLLGTGDIGRILGIGWKPFEDMFTTKVRINTSRKYKGSRTEPDLEESQIRLLGESKVTRRMLLSITNSCYDPLGVMCPLTIQLKIELRNLYRKELALSWDDDIPLEMKKKWVNLILKLKSIDGIEFRRCVFDPESVGHPELELCVGDRVLVKNVETGGPGKLRSSWEQTVYVVEKVDKVVYTVHEENNPTKIKVVHRNMILPCKNLVLAKELVIQKKKKVAPTQKSVKFDVEVADNHSEDDDGE